MSAPSAPATTPGQLLLATPPAGMAATGPRLTPFARVRRLAHAIPDRLIGPAITAACMLAFTATALVALLLEAPRSLPGATVVTAAQAQQAIADGAAVIDVREAFAFNRERIAGAVSAPDAPGLALAGASHSLDTPLVVYGDGAEAWRSHDVAQQAVRAGYRRVHWMRGGLPEWRANGYPVSRAAGQGDQP